MAAATHDREKTRTLKVRLQSDVAGCSASRISRSRTLKVRLHARSRAIRILNRQRTVHMDTAAASGLASFVLDAEHVGAPIGINIVVVGADAMRRYNADYTGRSYATDVLSFPAEAPLCAAPDDVPVVGDVIVSADQAVKYGRAHGIPIDEELGRYVVHGVLHCLGYDDTTDPARTRMFARQELLLRQWRTGARGSVSKACSRNRKAEDVILPPRDVRPCRTRKGRQ